MAASFDAEFSDIHARLNRVERRARRTARRTSPVLRSLSRESQHLADKMDDVNAAINYLDELRRRHRGKAGRHVLAV